MMIMERSFAEARGFQWHANIACIVNGEPRTWDQIHTERKKRQTERLRRILTFDGQVRIPCLVWTFYVPGIIYGGWHLYLRSNRNSWWVRERGGEEEMIAYCMNTWPCGVLPFRENFYEWKEAFAKTYTHGKRGRKPQGIRYGWATCRHSGQFPSLFEAQP